MNDLPGFEKVFGGTGEQMVSSESLAKYFGVAKRTIQHWSKNEGMPRVESDRYPLGRVQDWYIQRLRNELNKLRADNPLLQEKLKQVTLANLNSIMDLREKAKQLVPVSNVKIVIGYFKSTVNSSLDAYIEDILTLLKPDINSEKEMKIRESYNELKRLLSCLSIKDKLIREESLLDDDFILKVNMETDVANSPNTE